MKAYDRALRLVGRYALVWGIALTSGCATAGERFTPPSAADLAERQSWSADDKLIGTSYFYWYRWPDMHFFDDDQQRDDALTDHFVDPKVVSMESKAWHKQQMVDMMAAGIDMAWPVYWAAPGNFDDPLYSCYVSGLAPLQQTLDELRAEGKNPPRLGLFYDTSSLLRSVRTGTPDAAGDADLTTQEGRDVFYGTIRSFFCTVHPRHWACIDGRPIVVLYASGFTEAYDQAAFDYVYQRFAAEFDGVKPYIIREQSWKVQTESDYRWGSSLHGPFIDGIAAVGPGYDDRAVPKRATPIREREYGNFYRKNWLGVLRSPARIVHIETWNEMHEGTDICESREYGRQYIKLTAHYAAHFKAGTVPDEKVALKHVAPVLRPPNMKEGQEYAGAELVKIFVAGGKVQQRGVTRKQQSDGRLTVVKYGGDEFLRTDGGFDLRFAYFGVSDPCYFNQHGKVEVTIEYLDKGAGEVQLQYDSFDTSATFQGSYTNTPIFKLTNTGTIKKQSIVLENSRFANRQNGGSDFRYFVDGGPLYIKSVQVRVIERGRSGSES